MGFRIAACLLAIGCAASSPPTETAPRVELRSDAWTMSYRLVLDDPAAPRLEGSAEITNHSTRDWSEVKVTLATLATSTNDRDGDGLIDAADLCPEDREDIDGHNDDDGCPENDNDYDRVLDDTDRCPNDAETYNGYDDEDGCPDRARAPSHSPGFDKWVYFGPNSDVVKPGSLPIVEAVAATILGNPPLPVIEVSGHTDPGERDPWSLSTRRAAAVRARLIDKGVPAEQLTLVPYGATQVIDHDTSAAARARNRRAGFAILKSDVEAKGIPPIRGSRPPFDPDPVGRVDDLRYDLAQPVTVRRGGTVKLAILDKPITAAQVLLWQPTVDVEDSGRHPFHAVRLVNSSGFVLQHGPIEIVDRGRVIARGTLRRTAIGATTWIRGDLDRGTTIAAPITLAERPLRAVGVTGGTLVVEDALVRTATYTISGASTRPLVLHHRKLAGHTPHALPPDTIELADRYVISAAVHQISVGEQQVRRTLRWLPSIPSPELATYLDGSTLPPDIRDGVRAAVAMVIGIEAHLRALAELRIKLAEVADRARGRLLDRSTRTELDKLANEIGQRTEQIERDRARVAELTRDLTFDPPPP